MLPQHFLAQMTFFGRSTCRDWCGMYTFRRLPCAFGFGGSPYKHQESIWARSLPETRPFGLPPGRDNDLLGRRYLDQSNQCTFVTTHHASLPLQGELSRWEKLLPEGCLRLPALWLPYWLLCSYRSLAPSFLFDRDASRYNVQAMFDDLAFYQYHVYRLPSKYIRELL